MKKLAAPILCFSLTTLLAGEASAQLWDPISTKPKPNMVIGFDTSVTMQITPITGGVSCGSGDGCHATWGGWGGRGGWPWGTVRLALATQELLLTLPLFKNEFVLGGFRYDTCGPWQSARVTYHTMPDAVTPLNSWTTTNQMITDIIGNWWTGPVPGNPTGYGICERRELNLPGAVAGAGNYLTPNGSNDSALLSAVVSGGIPGMAHIPTVPSAATSTTCYLPPPPALPHAPVNPVAVLAASLGAYSFPRYSVPPTAADIDSDICAPLESAWASLRTALLSCRSATSAAAFVNTNFLTVGGAIGTPAARAYWCNAAPMAANMCTSPASAMVSYNSCVCNPLQAGCFGSIGDACGVPYGWPARQQVAICEARDPASFGGAFNAQADNRVHAGGCRQNAALFFTDGLYGNTAQVAAEASLMITGASAPYASTDAVPVSNAYVFRASDYYQGYADAMALFLSGWAFSSYPASNLGQMELSFAEIVNRVEKGVFSGANMAFDTTESRVAFTITTIPGHQASAGLPDEQYLGRPSRLAWHAVSPAGVVTPAPICETDWRSRLHYPGLSTIPTLGLVPGPAPSDAQIGPRGRFYGVGGHNQGVNRARLVLNGLVDRNGDGAIDALDTMTGAITDDYFYSVLLDARSTQPVVVEAPRDLPTGISSSFFGQWENLPAIHTRPRMLYTAAGGFLVGFKVGDYTTVGCPLLGTAGVTQSYCYTEGADACGEVFRYMPSWVPWTPPVGGPGGYTDNDIIPQALTNGQLVVREVQTGFTPPLGAVGDFATVLVMAQGEAGRGMSALNISDPMAGASVLGEWYLPGWDDTASSEPGLYNFPGGALNGNRVVPRVVMTSGNGSTPMIYSFGVNGALTSWTLLKFGTTYPTQAVCFDGTNRGAITDCLVLGLNGTLLRVPVDKNGLFGAYVDISAAITPSVGELFYTRPAVYFGNDNKLNYVFGSGDIKNLSSPVVGTNHLFRVVDNYNETAIGGGVQTTTGVCMPTSGGTSGAIPLVGQAVVSPPVVKKGVVAWTTYSPMATGCVSGSAYLYAMDFMTCNDANSGGLRAPVSIGNGIPLSPAILRGGQTVLTKTSATPTGMAGAPRPVKTRGLGTVRPLPLYWRTELRTL